VPVAIGHGIYDQVISVEFARRARGLLEAAGVPLLYRESPMPHGIDPRFMQELRPWLADALSTPRPTPPRAARTRTA
jgi:predicted esterase